MSVLTTVYALAFYVAAVLFVGGLVTKIVQFARTPSPLPIPTMPAPMTRQGVVLRMIREVAFFESLFRSNKWIWVFSALFHGGLLLVVLRHMRYFQEPVWFWVTLIQPFGVYAGFAMAVGLAGLWARRFLVDRVRYISRPSDHLTLALLVGIALSGLGIKFVAHTDIIAFKAFTLGLIRFDWQPLPSDPLVLVHLALVYVLLAVFPYSKLLHAAGVFFSPTRTQVDCARERRLVAPWAAKLDEAQ